ncbi:uncharacterized protein F5147DRAFT_837412 [Suillus discolor]|uniref:DUF6533 domain-containing protein n=1 Tax=Suillus discolor TaxID=1912936 RepID=A0A9P7JTL8_9AGAM|nr:uncharacterized protein F5147DRAFT_837412 [Suillus discolor]KAG2107140.1 hypothetical protein F5147DRAFT_837412 [Suillus discolor]
MDIVFSYWTVAAGVVVVYDWALTVGQEIELIWKQRWSLMTALYLVIRYIGLPYSIINVLMNIPFVSLTDAVSYIMDYALNVTCVVVAAMVGVIMIARLHAMYQGSRMILITLVIIFLAANIAYGVNAAIALRHLVAQELILSGTYMCLFSFEGDGKLSFLMIWIINAVWELLALCLSVWIVVKHFRDLRRLGSSTGSTIRDCFRVLIRSHVHYFACFLANASCLAFITGASEMETSSYMEILTLGGVLQVLFGVQAFVLGPRLILSIRQYHAKFVAESDAETSMDPIAFQERVHVSTSSTV